MFADLLPCPFCGGKALHMTNPLGGMDFWVTCEVCSASTTVYEGKNASVSAYQAWNRRTNTMEAVQPAANNARDKINALIAEIYGVTPAERSYSREEVITYLQRALTSPVA